MSEYKLNPLKEELLNQEYYDIAYTRMIDKPNIDKNLISYLRTFEHEEIVEELITGKYTWSIPRKVQIAKHGTNKKRTVYIYSDKDRFVIGVVYRALSHLMSDKFNNNCFSYKRSVSTGQAIEYLKENRTEKLRYGVKMDIHAYFNSVKRERIVEMLNELLPYDSELSGLRKSLDMIFLDDKVVVGETVIDEFKSMIPGCALGSFFANYCLNELDKHFENEGVLYARYSDDIVILEESKERLNKHIETVKNYLQRYGLEMNPDKYMWFEPGDSIDFLGLKLRNDGKIDIADHAKMKIKKQIHRWCKKARKEMDMNGVSYEYAAKKVIKRLNLKNFKCFINHEETFGWCAYLFPRITTIDSLIELDYYTKDTLRALKTGKHNKANHRKTSDEELERLGWVSLVELYFLYKKDYDYYCEVIELI